MILAATVVRAADAVKELCNDGPMPKSDETQAVYDHIRRLIAERKAKVHN